MMNKLLTIENIINFHKDNKGLPKYKLDQFISYKKNDFKFQPIESNKQITSIIENSKKHDNYIYLKLISLIAKHSNMENLPVLLTNVLTLPLADSDIYKMMKKMRETKRDKPKINYGPCPLYLANRKKRVELMKDHLKKIIGNPDFKIKNYLDFGCGDCKNTFEYGKALGLKQENIYGADISNWFDYETSKRRDLNINFVEISENKKYEFKDNFFSIISCFMVLHHVMDLDFVMKELNRILEMGGYIYATEHQVVNNSERMLCDIEHSIYEISYRGHKDFYKKFYSEYHHWIEWDIIFSQYGFEPVGGNVLFYNITEETDPTKKAWILYKKIKNI